MSQEIESAVDVVVEHADVGQEALVVLVLICHRRQSAVVSLVSVTPVEEAPVADCLVLPYY